MQSPSKSQHNSSKNWKHKFSNSSGKAKIILNNKRMPAGITIPDLKLYYRAIVIKTAGYWYRAIFVDKWNRIEVPEIKPDTYLTFDEVAKNIQLKNESIFNKWCWSNWLSLCK